MKRSGRIKSRSAKRAAEAPARDACRAAVLERDGGCVAAGPLSPCGYFPDRPGLEVDERRGGSRRSTEHTDPDACQSLCPVHHDAKTAEPLAAGVLGLRGIEVQAAILATIEHDDRLLEAAEVEALDRFHRRARAIGQGARRR